MFNMYIFPAFLAILTPAIFQVQGLPSHPVRDRFELVIDRHATASGECTFVSVQPRQFYSKALVAPKDSISDARSDASPPSGGHLRVFSSDEAVLWSRAQSLCGADIVPAHHLLSGDADVTSEWVAGLGESQVAFEVPNDEDESLSQAVVPSPPLQIQPLIGSGPSRNRVDLVFFSDGYLPEERDKFIEDATRLAHDISGNQTFNTVKPLLNFWAAFSPSNESGIGTDGKPKDTPFGLFRDGTELRAVYYSKPEAAAAACKSMGDKCDYPILLGNDPLYGGLGGEYTVVTSSLANGPLVLRHELGHSIIDVGEEYDGGFAYFGPNAAHNLSDPLPWSHWLTQPNKGLDKPRVERSAMPFQAYPWTLLNTSVPWSTNFTSSGVYSRHLIRFSLSGLPEKSDLRVELDGNDLGWIPRVNIGVDRWHYDVYRDGGLSGGSHEVKFTLLNQEREGVAQLCSAEALEFGDENEFIASSGHYGIFPTYSETNETSYRPTNEDCLMRVVTSPNFCKVCIEGLWLSLLRRVDLIDDVREGCQWHANSDGPGGHWMKTLDARLVPLAQFRQPSNAATLKAAESYTVTWKKDGYVLEAFANKTRIEIDDDIAVGTYSIDVKYTTDEVRVDNDGLLTSGGEYTIARKCGV